MIYKENAEQTITFPPEGIKQGFKSYEAQQLRIIVQEELSPITDVNKVEAMGRIFLDIFEAIRWLYEKAGTLHRDISYSNVMFRTLKNGYISGVLTDFDLASSGNHSAPMSQQRTGTRPYMAVDLLYGDNPKYLYRHDLESLFYVMVRHAGRFDNRGQVVKNSFFRKWEGGGDTEQLYMVKTIFMTTVPNWSEYLTGPYLEAFEPCFSDIHWMFRRGFLARVEAKPRLSCRPPARVPALAFDNITLGGNVTFDDYSNFLSTLSS